MFNQGRAHQSSVIQSDPVQSSVIQSNPVHNQVQSRRRSPSAIKATLTKCWLSSPNWSPNTALTHGLMPPEPRATRARPTKRPARARAHSAAIRRNQRLSAPIATQSAAIRGHRTQSTTCALSGHHRCVSRRLRERGALRSTRATGTRPCGTCRAPPRLAALRRAGSGTRHW